MSPNKRVGFVGNNLPRRCGIATFTHDLHHAVATARPALETAIVAMNEPGSAYDYPASVRIQVRQESIEDYVAAAGFLNDGGYDAVSLQHEYGIFGGAAGGHIVELLSRLKMPLVTTLHTVLKEPAPAQRHVMQRIIDESATMVVMSERARQFLRVAHDVPARKIAVIPHGIPDRPFQQPDQAKIKCGFAGKPIILTFGLLSPNKGIEFMLDAMPQIIESCPNAIYVVLGATHPNLVRQQGEAYRETLTVRAKERGIEDHVAFINHFVDHATLLDFIAMCDVYVTPYLNAAQMTSGTLAYSFGLGKAVVSTPYWHAKDLLAHGRGVVVPFSDSAALGSEISRLLTDHARRNALRERAYAASRSMTWAHTAERYLSAFGKARVQAAAAHAIPASFEEGGDSVIPEIRIGHFLSLCDSTGILQHAVHCVPDRAHGYCVDDNARALMLANKLALSGDNPLPEAVTSRLSAFIQHAWNPDTLRFRNFMSYDRRWLEDTGSEDSHGRTLWALGETARDDSDPSRRRWAADLFKAALPAVKGFSSPRAWAFVLLGLDAYIEMAAEEASAAVMRETLADKLMSQFADNATKDWSWYENLLAYDNARLPQALIQTGVAMRRPTYIETGLRSLRWLISLQTTSDGIFRPVGTGSFGRLHQKPQAFDQQPVEACATIAACVAAWNLGHGPEWPIAAACAFGWFFGQNDLHVSLIDAETGSCLDGLHPDRANENRGAESTLSYLLAQTQMRRLMHAAEIDAHQPTADLANGLVATVAPRTAFVRRFARTSISDPPDPIPAAGSGPGSRAAVQAGN
jgi:glycosyltransferase involved in cell wall biosynthesis